MRAFHAIHIDGIVTIEPTDKESVFGLFACATATAAPNTSQDDYSLTSVAIAMIGTLDPNHKSRPVSSTVLFPRSIYDPTRGFAIAQYFEGSSHPGELIFTVIVYHPSLIKP